MRLLTPLQVLVDTTMPTQTGTTSTVNANADFTNALKNSAFGDSIVLTVGNTFTGPFTLPNKSGSGWIIRADFKEKGADSQAIADWNGPGPFKLVNNYLEGAGENVMFGGADPAIPNLVPADIEIRRNHLNKPLSWKVGEPSYAGTPWTVKNLHLWQQRFLHPDHVVQVTVRRLGLHHSKAPGGNHSPPELEGRTRRRHRASRESYAPLSCWRVRAARAPEREEDLRGAHSVRSIALV